MPEIDITRVINRHDTSRAKVEIIKKSQDWVAVTNCLLICITPGWVGFEYSRPTTITETLNAITGWNTKVDDLMMTGERVNNLCRCLNAREGLSRTHDWLPPRFLEDPLPDGPSKGHRITEEELRNMLDNYYELRGWSKESGNPTQKKLEELGLEFARYPE